MFGIDDVLLSPFKGAMRALRAIHEAVEKELYDTDGIVAALQELHAALEAGAIDEAEFETRETELLDRLEAIERAQGIGDDDGGDPSDRGARTPHRQ